MHTVNMYLGVPLLQESTGYRVEVMTVRKLEFETDAFAFADRVGPGGLLHRACVAFRTMGRGLRPARRLPAWMSEAVALRLQFCR